MVNTTELIENVLNNIEEDLYKCESRDSINKLYRQARIWVRITGCYGKGFTIEESRKINQILKHLRWAAIARLEGGVDND